MVAVIDKESKLPMIIEDDVFLEDAKNGFVNFQPATAENLFVAAKKAKAPLAAEFEEIILKSPEYAASYAGLVRNSVWPEAEDVIKTDAKASYQYARYCRKERWGEPDAEMVIAKNPLWAVYYAKEVIKGRFEEAEPFIAESPKFALQYAQDVIEGPFEMAEAKIRDSSYFSNQYDSFLESLGVSRPSL